jgi:3-hydroxyisobutyrate dehydrogenase
MARIAFIGLGVMGYPMAGHLSSCGYHQLTVFNRRTAKADRWVAEFGGRQAASASEAARDAELVFTCVGNDQDLRDLFLGSAGVYACMSAGSIHIDHTSSSATTARDLESWAQKYGVRFLDAPVSGGQEGAVAGKLTVMAGGDQAVFSEISPILQCYATKIGYMGPAGSGQLAKMVNQICIAGLIQALAEGIHFAQRSGLDVERVFEVISEGAAQSWQMERRFRTMADSKFDFGFAIDLARKDLSNALEEGQRYSASLPVTKLVNEFYGEIQAMGGGRWDTSSLIARLPRQ